MQKRRSPTHALNKHSARSALTLPLFTHTLVMHPLIQRAPTMHARPTTLSRTVTHSLTIYYHIHHTLTTHHSVTQSPLTCHFFTVQSPPHPLTPSPHTRALTTVNSHARRSPCNHVPTTHSRTHHTITYRPRSYTLNKHSRTRQTLMLHSLRTRTLVVHSHSTHHALIHSPPTHLISPTNHPITGILYLLKYWF